MERTNAGEKEPEYVPSDDENAINLEHILPENPGASWKGIDPDVAHAHFRRLGNTVLLQASKNSIIGNSAFTDKKKVLSASSFTLTSEVGKRSIWGPKEIGERQQRLAELAIKTWPQSL